MRTGTASVILIAACLLCGRIGPWKTRVQLCSRGSPGRRQRRKSNSISDSRQPLSKNIFRKIEVGKRKHGHATRGRASPEYGIWNAMHARCTLPNNKCFNIYGGRGIKVCERWRSFENFIADMGPRPSLKHSLDRYPNGDGDYEPGNCRWATSIEQGSNKRNNHLIEIDGETKTVSAWARERGLHKDLIFGRLGRGWTPRDAVMRPAQTSRRGCIGVFT